VSQLFLEGIEKELRSHMPDGSYISFSADKKLKMSHRE
jgi:hypothetical protein